MSRKSYKKNKEVEDHWYFDIAFHFGTTITLFIVILNYSTLSPLIPIFGFFFFTIKVIFPFSSFSTMWINTTICLCINQNMIQMVQLVLRLNCILS